MSGINAQSSNSKLYNNTISHIYWLLLVSRARMIGHGDVSIARLDCRVCNLFISGVPMVQLDYTIERRLLSTWGNPEVLDFYGGGWSAHDPSLAVPFPEIQTCCSLGFWSILNFLMVIGISIGWPWVAKTSALLIENHKYWSLKVSWRL